MERKHGFLKKGKRSILIQRHKYLQHFDEFMLRKKIVFRISEGCEPKIKRSS